MVRLGIPYTDMGTSWMKRYEGHELNTRAAPHNSMRSITFNHYCDVSRKPRDLIARENLNVAMHALSKTPCIESAPLIRSKAKKTKALTRRKRK